VLIHAGTYPLIHLSKPHDPPPAHVNAANFIAAHLPLTPVPAVQEISLHTARPDSGLGGMRAQASAPPYFAYPWSGGMALARYLLDHPQRVAGRTVLDLGSGSGLVAIAAMKAGAASAIAAEIDPDATQAIALNARANGVSVAVLHKDVSQETPPPVDLVLVGDLFYARTLARRVTMFLDRCLGTGIEVLVGDPHRAHLPVRRLRQLASYDVPDMGNVIGPATRPGAVFAYVGKPR